ncbi:MAG: amidase [Candidatus Nanopelagicales bacterium]
MSGRDDALGDSDLVDLVARVDRREVSPAELVDAAIARSEVVDPAVNAIVSRVPDPRPAADAERLPLRGLPTFIKDNEALAGLPTRQGSRAVTDRPARESMPWARQAIALGATPLGKSTLPEFGLTPTTECLLTGATRNPWDLSRSAGGSSGGAAALVAAGVTPLAHANDGGGSIRIPASCCGLVGLKPTRGRIIDIEEVESLPVNVTTQGVVTRTVRDTAYYFAAAERAYRNLALPPIGHVTRPGPRRRIALLTTGHGTMVTQPEVADAVRSAAALFESLGHQVEEIPFPFDNDIGIAFLRYWAFLAYGIKRLGARLYGAGFNPGLLESYTLELARMFAAGPGLLPAAIRRMKRFPESYAEAFAGYDAVLSPVLGHEPPPIGFLGPEVEPREHLVRLLRYVSMTPLQNIAGTPAISLPLGATPSGLPIGVQVAAAWGQERLLLELALEAEEARPFARLPGA